MSELNTRLHRVVPDQGRGCDECLKASRAALGIKPEADPMESRPVRWLAVLLVVIAICAALEKML